MLERYAERKAGAGRLDFLDLLLKTRDLMRGNAAVRRELQARFTHLFVDEFQDTDPLQAEILLLLAADDPAETDWRRARPVAGKLFVVGDPKQSIYRFRRADVALYETIKRRLIAAGAACRASDREFPRRPRDSGGGERGVRAAHAAGLAEPGRLRAAHSRARRGRRSARGRRAPRPGALRRLGQDLQLEDRRCRSRTRWRRSSSGWCVTAAGPSANAVSRAPGCRSTRATSVSSSGVSGPSVAT